MDRGTSPDTVLAWADTTPGANPDGDYSSSGGALTDDMTGNLVGVSLRGATLRTATITASGGTFTPPMTPSLAGGGWHAVALRNDGTVWTWAGLGQQLGDGTTGLGFPPVQVHGVNDVGFLTNIVAVAAGNEHSLALTSSGTVVAWGGNGDGQLGDGTTTQRLTPVQVSGLSNVTVIAANYYQSFALRSDGTVWAWGDNSDDQLGDASGIGQSAPVQVCATGETAPCTQYLSGIIAIAAGDFHTLALRSDGTVWAWGGNAYGELGDGTTSSRPAPVQVCASGQTAPCASFLNGVTAITAGSFHSLALKSDGTVWGWGDNIDGELGDGTNDPRSTPVQVLGQGGTGTLTGIVGIDTGNEHTLALADDGTVWAWGYNGFGSLGNGTTANSFTPIMVSGLTNPTLVRVNNYFTSYVLQDDGTVMAWGWNDNGELGYTSSGTCGVQSRDCATTPGMVGSLDLIP